MQTGSLMNLVMMGSKGAEKVEVGMGATKLGWTDRTAFTVVEVKSDRHIVVQQDYAKRTDTKGMSDSQQYEYTQDPNGVKYEVTLRITGQWVVKGEGAKTGRKFLLGVREEYYDYSF